MEKEIKQERRSFTIWEKFLRIGKFLYYKVLRIPASPQMIARGLAVGVFMGLMPLLPIQTLCAVVMAVLLSGSKIAAAIGTWVSNPLNYVPLYIAYYSIGEFLLPFHEQGPPTEQIGLIEFFTNSPKLLTIMLTGGFVLALPCSLLTYFITVRIIRTYQEKRQKNISQSNVSATKMH